MLTREDKPQRRPKGSIKLVKLGIKSNVRRRQYKEERTLFFLMKRSTCRYGRYVINVITSVNVIFNVY